MGALDGFAFRGMHTEGPPDVRVALRRMQRSLRPCSAQALQRFNEWQSLELRYLPG
jgi:hypothetical protein